MTKLKQLIRDPEAAFDEPDDVVECANLSDKEKIAVLESWHTDLVEMQKAVEENMASESMEAGETAARLALVTAAISRAREQSEPDR